MQLPNADRAVVWRRRAVAPEGLPEPGVGGSIPYLTS